ncbi:hypothetical protein HNQ99_003186 [Rhizorhapis suberifaciens]|uniref:Uncharacterized protein n=1 Tax=Rhizorhapis suberifaciens TaxID=13656 RepID=A0A840HZ59_9SPHN|nr:hypothetical protein [Rhizorhapis suberifaciens]
MRSRFDESTEFLEPTRKLDRAIVGSSDFVSSSRSAIVAMRALRAKEVRASDWKCESLGIPLA